MAGAVGGATGTLINLFVGFFVGLSSGATVIISQFYGARKEKPTEDSVHTAVAMGIAGGLLLTVIGMLLAPTMLKMMDTPDDVLEPAVTYLRIYFAGMVFNLLYNIGSSILRAIGDSRRPLYILIVCTLTNLVLDLAFVLLFHMGVAGAGLATILSQAISALLVLYFLSRSNECYKLTVRKIRFHSDILRHIIKIGLPAGIQSSMFCISNIIIQSTINTFGTDTMAAWTAYGKIDSVFWMLMSAFGISITTFSGQNFGCGKLDRREKERAYFIGNGARLLDAAFGNPAATRTIHFSSVYRRWQCFRAGSAYFANPCAVLCNLRARRVAFPAQSAAQANRCCQC